MVNEAPSTYKLGPGTLVVGEVGTPVDFTPQVTGATVSWDKDKDDDVPVLSGGSLTGDTTYTATLSANVFQDLADDDGIVAYSWEHKGETVPVTFIPSTAAGKQVTGDVVMDPIDIGGDEAKQRPRSDIEWAFVGEPALEDVAP